MKRKWMSLALSLALSLGLATPASAHGAIAAPPTATGRPTATVSSDCVSAAIKADGSLWVWGYNKYGQVGNGGGCNDYYAYDERNPIQTVPVKVMDNVACVSVGSYCSAAVKTDGTLWTWGEGSNGWLGDGGDEDRDTPKKILDNVASVSCGFYHSAAVKTDGTLWTWGTGEHGQLGNGVDDGWVRHTRPKKVMDNVASVSCGICNTAVIKTDGSLWMWGDNVFGAIGNGRGGSGDVSKDEQELTPVKIMDDVAAVCTRSNVTAAIKTDGTLWLWGDNRLGGVGNGSTGIVNSPVKVMDNVACVSVGDLCSTAVKTDGTLWTWGSNRYGALGNGTGQDYQGWEKLCETVPGKIMDNVACATKGMAVKTDGTLWTWGDNQHGDLGNGKWGGFVCSPIQVMDGVAAPALPSPTVAGFRDVHENDYFAQAVQWAKETGVTSGTGGGSFSPAAPVTRAEAVTFLWRAAGKPEPSSDASPFTDVTDPNAFYYKAVLWAAETGITNGDGSGRFGLDGTLAYDQILTFLCRAAGGSAGGGDWSAAAVAWASGNGLTDGLSFSAKAGCPRSDVVYCLWKQLGMR